MSSSRVGLAILFFAMFGPAIARGQVVIPPPRPLVGIPEQNPEQGDAASDILGPEEPQGFGIGAAEPPAGVPELPAAATRRRMCDVVRESILGAASEDDWQPLSLSTFFTDGWDRPFVRSPRGTNGAPKQNWFGSADGIFVRLNSVSLFYTNGLTTNPGLLMAPVPWAPSKPNTTGNDYFATYNLYLPLNQRLELLVVVPFLSSNPTSPTGHYVTNFGDLTFSERFRLIEQRNFSLQAVLTERTPTGQTVNGNDINYITPAVEFWSNFAPKWVVRGSTGINIDTGRPSATDTYANNLALGRYITNEDVRFFKNLVFHLSAATLTDLLGRKDHITDVLISPGFRFDLSGDRKWAVLSAMQIPVSAPRPYSWQIDFALVRTF